MSTSQDRGVSNFPVARVNRIIKQDQDVNLCSKEAIFLISKATEHMINRMTNQALGQAKLTKRDAKTIKYNDLASVASQPQWFYLGEVIPLPIPVKTAVEKHTKQRNNDQPDETTTSVATVFGKTSSRSTMSTGNGVGGGMVGGGGGTTESGLPEKTLNKNRVLKSGKRKSLLLNQQREQGVGEGGVTKMHELGGDLESTKRKTRGKKIALPAGEGGGPDYFEGDEEDEEDGEEEYDESRATSEVGGEMDLDV